MTQKTKTNQLIALMVLLTACGSESAPNDSEIAPVPAPPPPATFEDVSANSTAHQAQRQPVSRVLGDAVVIPQLGSLTQPTVVRLIPTEQLPPAQIADGLAIEAIDADWRRADE